MSQSLPNLKRELRKNGSPSVGEEIENGATPYWGKGSKEKVAKIDEKDDGYRLDDDNDGGIFDSNRNFEKHNLFKIDFNALKNV